MAHFAELDENNVVLRVIVIDNDDVANNGGDQSVSAENFVKSIVPFSENGKSWKQTYYNENFRGQYASITMEYNSTKDEFDDPE